MVKAGDATGDALCDPEAGRRCQLPRTRHLDADNVGGNCEFGDFEENEKQIDAEWRRTAIFYGDASLRV